MDVYLDFDGVLCNSLLECYNSSWFAWKGLDIGPSAPPPPPAQGELWERFVKCRPYIRSGEDYVALHELLSRGILPQSQVDFDGELAALGPVLLEQFKSKLYQVREDLLGYHGDLWNSWNPLYPGLATALGLLVGQDEVSILSTKKAAFIFEILRYHGVNWPLERIYYTGPEKKLSIIERRQGGARAILVDDQIDHLDFSHGTIDCRLALWGFVTPRVLDPGVRTLSLGEFIQFLGGLLDLRSQ